jgi:hypothetical protein
MDRGSYRGGCPMSRDPNFRTEDDEHFAWVAMRDGLPAAFDEGATVVRYGGTTITRDGDFVTFSNPMAATVTVPYSADAPEALGAAWRGFSLAVVTECDEAMADLAPFVPFGGIH